LQIVTTEMSTLFDRGVFTLPAGGRVGDGRGRRSPRHAAGNHVRREVR
jgi:hypothetical protein